jgi:fluoroacetyl-CoA thioesterase
MPKPVPLGTRASNQERVTFQQTLTAFYPELPPVYSTPNLVALMEFAAHTALEPYCEKDEISVGTAINIEHLAASGVDAQVQAEAVLESFDGRFYVFRVSARDERRQIGRGTVTRAIINVPKFMARLGRK